MSKKDFIALADALRPIGRDNIRTEVLEALVGFCKSRNPRFNADRWYGYLEGRCGPNGGAIKSKALAVDN